MLGVAPGNADIAQSPQQALDHCIRPSVGWPASVTTKGLHIMKRKLLVAAICTALALPAVPMIVHAQDAATQTKQDKKEAKKLKEVVVTGSLIPQSEIETASPVMVITGDAVSLSDCGISEPVTTTSVSFLASCLSCVV